MNGQTGWADAHPSGCVLSCVTLWMNMAVWTLHLIQYASLTASTRQCPLFSTTFNIFFEHNNVSTKVTFKKKKRKKTELNSLFKSLTQEDRLQTDVRNTDETVTKREPGSNCQGQLGRDREQEASRITRVQGAIQNNLEATSTKANIPVLH